MDYKALRDTYQTPFYIYDFDAIKERFLHLKEAFKARKSQIFYALKANSNLSLLAHLVRLDSGFDCVSIGEVKRALRAGAKPYKIIFSGVGKSESELKEALNLDILYINLESDAEMLVLEKVAKALNLKARISIRVNPNVDAKTHPYIATGLNENKFGVKLEVAKKMYLYAQNSDFLEPVGIHFHIGSQLLDTSPIIEAAKIIASLVRELKSANIELKFFDVGGGLGVVYENEQEPDLYEYAQGILSCLNGLDVTICVEPGRFLVAKSGELVSSVLYEKITPSKRFIIVDAAMNDLIRPSLYEAYHEIVLPYNDNEKSLCDVVGGICESGDFFAKDRMLPKSKSGDILVIKNSGAYGFSMSSNYNSRPRVCELAIEDKKVRLIRRRESFEDLIALELLGSKI
ncbi:MULTISPECIES: diaminopimelate decarboxylase [unclassified Campylobacter]|uniref:diaminopimelate decarboxylase n=1 Tax=unclassified Campylobacter TaxID=2593542 RepID=UPI001237B313|nr:MULTISPECIES: diaminopimelate decarboxylase [unclassified Campylobacter]KAA6227209.1 diaminopimelate decarboxylase [Campylobacter sp. LR286c]KAA6227917.1 diaminopimelate decarboxylase [Campylobacter sp. LR185c]KAA6228326.1 diaminopimelate decarboxylase [Campylobacter sp. LR196d]KAA6229327.1 diaminopimelate decarboxylase [Campylobacter sp. LR291e]KAA6231133.1 diaminopimelate decarboxylase [Campylobacter sp. LR264d]